jgi:hypothetical protein
MTTTITFQAITRERAEKLMSTAIEEAKQLQAIAPDLDHEAGCPGDHGCTCRIASRRENARALLQLIASGAVIVAESGLTQARLKPDAQVATAVLVGAARMAGQMLRGAIDRQMLAIRHAHGRLQDVAALFESLPGIVR